jgi:ribulose-phosphate 3-epimerase
MVADPHNIGCDFIRAGAQRIIAQWESFHSAEEVRGVVDSWESRGAVVGLSILVPTDIEQLLAYVASDSRIVSIQIMSIDPIGMQGRPFDTRAIARIKEVRARFPHLEISVDGSMNAQSIPVVLHAGATRTVVGSAVSKQPYPPEAYAALCKSVEKVMR